MANISKDIGVLAVLAKRMVEERLPKALELKERVDRGEVLNDLDIAFLERVFADAKDLGPIIDKDARARDVAGRMISLYKEIMNKALENENAKKGS
ncbi:MAG TPA: hypothetical protein VEG25_00920 [Burkholderiales bacterium]|nr:hypothetical protein [Burkholderiales bacterium]